MKKINYILLISSLICIISWSIISYEILKDRTVRLNGSLINVEIIDFGYRRFNKYAEVNIQGVRIDAGGIRDKYKLGDTIRVYYIQGVNRVVQEHVNPNRYYWYLGFSSILLILGIAFLVESLKGKSIWSYL